MPGSRFHRDRFRPAPQNLNASLPKASPVALTSHTSHEARDICPLMASLRLLREGQGTRRLGATGYASKLPV